MSDEGPKRYGSEQTLVIPRESLAPVSRPILVTDAGEEPRYDPEAITLVPCPACEGQALVTIQKRAEIAAALAPELDAPDEEPAA